ncbi:MAG: oligosaccharide flippase family protein [Anaerolineales bacterium]|jgi:O-antigen/teichoic acid export membrane protein|nr:oligosaccharide flippase family protein [Anaerolineales bacterium]
MSIFSKLKDIWQSDPLLRRVVKNSGHLLSANAVAALLGFAQGILAVRLIGVTDWGLAATVITFASNINRFLTFRMSEVVVQRMGAALAEGKKSQAAVTAKAALLTEAATSILAFTILLALTPWAALNLAKDIQLAPLFALYGIILLTNIAAESSTGVLQTLRRFNWIARVNMIQALVTAALIGLAYLTRGGLFEIVLAFVVGKTINGLGLAFLALRELHKTLGPDWWKAPLASLPEKRGMLSFMINTNLNGTVNLFTRDNIPLYLAALLSVTEVGYFKLALSLINLVLLPLDPFIWPTYAEITQTIAAKAWQKTRQLLRRVSLITGTVVLAVGGGLMLSGWLLLPLLYGPEAAPAYPVLLILLVGYGFASIFQWNRPLLLALGKPSFPVLVSFLVGLVELGLIFWLAPRFGYLALAAILSAYFVVSIGIIVWRGLAEIKQRERAN